MKKNTIMQEYQRRNVDAKKKLNTKAQVKKWF